MPTPPPTLPAMDSRAADHADFSLNAKLLDDDDQGGATVLPPSSHTLSVDVKPSGAAEQADSEASALARGSPCLVTSLVWLLFLSHAGCMVYALKVRGVCVCVCVCVRACACARVRACVSLCCCRRPRRSRDHAWSPVDNGSPSREWGGVGRLHDATNGRRVRVWRVWGAVISGAPSSHLTHTCSVSPSAH